MNRILLLRSIIVVVVIDVVVFDVAIIIVVVVDVLHTVFFGCVLLLPHQGRWLKWIFVRLFKNIFIRIRLHGEKSRVTSDTAQHSHIANNSMDTQCNTPHTISIRLGTRIIIIELRETCGCARDWFDAEPFILSLSMCRLCAWCYSFLSLHILAYGTRETKRWSGSVLENIVVSAVQYESNLLTVFSVRAVLCPILCSLCFFFSVGTTE